MKNGPDSFAGEKYFSADSTLQLADIYREVCEMEKSRIEPMKSSIREAYGKSQSAFENIPDGEEKDKLQLFTFICSLSFDVYLKKMMIERIIDELGSKSKKE